jgi:glycosyltransferase involved in cell wall biosynthesis
MELHALQPLSRPKEALAQISYHWSDKIIVLSDAAKKYLTDEKCLPNKKVVVVRNGIDYERFQNVASPLSGPVFDNVGPKIGYIGTFYQWQGIYELLESAQYVFEKIPDAIFIFVGEGPEKENLKRRASQISEKRIHILDQVTPNEVPAYISALDLFCMLRPPSRATELTLPLKIFEVGMTKTPLLISDMPGLLEAGGNSPQMFFNIQSDLSPRAVANRIVNLLSKEKATTLQQKAQAYYDYVRKGDFTWRKSAEILKAIYLGLVNK